MGEIAQEKFPDGLNQENIFYVPPDSSRLKTTPVTKEVVNLPPIVQGAQEIVELTKLQLEVQEAAAETEPYLPIIEAILERTRPLTAEEKELAKDKKYGKTLERLGEAVAKQEDYRENCTGQGKLILNVVAWQLSQGVKSVDDGAT
jgi:hypothetical protein